MTSDKYILNAIFYIVLSSFFIYLLIREEKIEKKIKIIRGKISDYIIRVTKMKNEKMKKFLRKFIDISETLITTVAIVLVLQFFYIGNFKVPTGSMIPTIIPNDRLLGNMVVYKFKKPQREDIVVFREPINNKDRYTKRIMGLPGETVYIKNGILYVDETPMTKRRYSNIEDIRNKTWYIPKKGDLLHIIPGKNYKKYYKNYDIDVQELQQKIYENPLEKTIDLMPDLVFKVNGHKTGMILDFLHSNKNLNKLLAGEIVEIELENDYYLALGDNTDSSFDSRSWGFVNEKRIMGKALFRFWPLNRIGMLK